MGLWDWAVAAYGRPGVAPACLDLQDRFEQNVPLLLAAAWSAAQGRTLDLDAAVALTRAWEADVVAPLRAARRGLKIAHRPIPDAGREALRETVKAVELESERLLLAALETLAWPGQAAPLEPALGRAAAAWATAKNSAPPTREVAVLAAALID